MVNTKLENELYKTHLIERIVKKNAMYLSSYPDEAKTVCRVYKQLERLSIDVLEYLDATTNRN